MEQMALLLSLQSMKIMTRLAVLCLALLLQRSSEAQTPFLFRITLRGVCHQTDSSGNIVTTPITEASLLQDAAQAGGVDPKTLAIVYHVQGSSFGDTIDVVNANTGAVATTLYGLFFGDDSVQTLGRTALTNSAGTEVRRVDYIYTSQNSHSMGASFTTKRFIIDKNGSVHTTINGEMEWTVNPVGNSSTKVCTATFTTTKSFP
jgi:hypothetical protein